jgi:predicted RNA-binding protein (virulence factor B family)
MKNHPDRTFVHQRHIEKGIKAYGGKIDLPLQDLLKRSDWQYTPYRFRDNRILLVYENELFGILYKNERALHLHLEEEGQ